jgi:hypothetical protein
VDLRKNELLVALALAEFAHADGSSVRPGRKRIARMTGYSHKQVQRLIDRLEAKGILVKVAEERHHRPPEYRFDLGAGGPNETDTHPDRGDIAMSTLPTSQEGAPIPPPDPLLDPHRGAQGGHFEPVRVDISDDQGGHFEREGGHSCVHQTSIEPSVNPPEENLEASKLAGPATEARPKAALGRAFTKWAELLRPGSNVRLTDARAKAYFSRRSRDGFTEDDLLRVIEAAHVAVERDEFDYAHHATEFYRLFVDREHVEAWLKYEETGDYCVLSEMLITEAPWEQEDHPWVNPFDEPAESEPAAATVNGDGGGEQAKTGNEQEQARPSLSGSVSPYERLTGLPCGQRSLELTRYEGMRVFAAELGVDVSSASTARLDRLLGAFPGEAVA